MIDLSIDQKSSTLRAISLSGELDGSAHIHHKSTGVIRKIDVPLLPSQLGQ
ncbi:MAG TPA: hypothetical protein VFW40_12265 [Capsulimonadaceae bacterium]|nr:hypothetical protein [Capsulimonadaceae bacterium]